ncbi:MAG TPA: hypothetical protein VEF06_02125 [Bryobacteraceae bacterium]|nr:hypothetical protein [Bryobacteraceae bacterium]
MRKIALPASFGLVLALAAVSDTPARRLSGNFWLGSASDGFGERSHGILEETPSGWKFYPLPQSSIEAYNRLRPRAPGDASSRPTTENYQRQEVIGPWQVEGDRVWLGNQYYDGEGDTGVGAFGYFDFPSRKYTLFSPPEVARWEISALLVEPDAVWLGLDHFGEDISTFPGGFVRWDRARQEARLYSAEFVITRIERDSQDPARLRLTTRGGYAFFRNGNLQRFRDDGSSIERFPPPPTHY